MFFFIELQNEENSHNYENKQERNDKIRDAWLVRRVINTFLNLRQDLFKVSNLCGTIISYSKYLKKSTAQLDFYPKTGYLCALLVGSIALSRAASIQIFTQSLTPIFRCKGKHTLMDPLIWNF